MKLVKKLFFIAAGCMFLVSCLEISDETAINENGSGVLSQAIDMGQLIDMMQAMGGEEFDKHKDEKIDSVIYMKDIVDTAKNMTAEQKNLMRGGKISIKMNMEAKEFKIQMQYPFDNLDNLQKLNAGLGDAGTGLGSIMKEFGGNGGQPESGQDSPEMGMLLQVFDYKISNGLIKRTVNPAKLKALLDDPKMAEMKSGADMGIEVAYNVVYKLPRPVKKVDNVKADLSANKKVVTLKMNLLKIFTDPDQFAYTIEY